jgi:hypothetical protein
MKRKNGEDSNSSKSWCYKLLQFRNRNIIGDLDLAIIGDLDLCKIKKDRPEEVSFYFCFCDICNLIIQ